MRKISMVAAATVILAALGGCETMNSLLDDKPAGQSENTQSASASAPAMAPQQQDVTFVQKAAAAGDKEVALGNLALGRSQNVAVDGFAQEMVTDHTQAGQKLMALAKAGSIEVPAAPSEEQVAMDAGLSDLKGKAFDRAYADMMVKDHEEAVALFETEAATGSDPALQAFAQDTLPTLRTHLEHARTLQGSL
jgi:putative membrane protein